ncbi:MAG: PepSY-associated TM helix domain-containing protein [Bacteroidota bacterium]
MARKKRKKNIIKEVLSWLHLWLGLIAGIIVFISMIGASIFVWEEELTNWWYADAVYNEETSTDKATISMSQAYAAARKAHPNKEFTFVEVLNKPNRNYAVRSYKAAEEKGWTWASGIEHYLVVFVNPYTGQVEGEIDKKRDWITQMRFLHQNLLLRSDVGTEIVGAAALIMIILALTGLYLWWPKNKKVLKQRLKVKWKASFKRVNWDVHSVGGFYTYLFLIFFAATGLVWTYKWWSNGIYRMLGDNPKEVFQRPDPPTLTKGDYIPTADQVYADAIARQPKWDKLYLNVPKADAEKGTISAGLYYKGNSWWEMSDYYYYHPETAGLEYSMAHDEKMTGEKWRHSNYAMHVGSIYGTPTKIIAFICALFFAVLPVSGFLIWWGRKKKKNRAAQRRSARVTTRTTIAEPKVIVTNLKTKNT